MAQTAESTPTFLTPAEVSKRWNGAVSTGTLANWRSAKTGPTYQKFGSRVRYPLLALIKYEAKNEQLAAANDNDEQEAKK